MTLAHRLGAFAALALTLVLGACSTSADVAVPGLEPQFGTANQDVPADVAAGPSGAVYNLYNYVSPGYYDYYGNYEEYGSEAVGVLTRYDALGKSVWEREVFRNGCSDGYCTTYTAQAVYADKNNYTYVLVQSVKGYEPDVDPYVSYSVYKYAPQGEFIDSIYLDYFDGSASDVSLKLAIDSNGNLYVVTQGNRYDPARYYLAKYTTNGALVWERRSSTTPAYGKPNDITVSSNGDIYVVGSTGFGKYTSTGNLSWTKAGATDDILIAATHLYIRSGATVIRKIDGNGKILWSKTQSGYSSLILADMGGDSSGNLYLAGKFTASGRSRDVVVRKLNSSGTTVWTKTFGTTLYDDAKGIATLGGTEIYLTGLTQGSIAHTNRGGDDGFLRKYNSSGTTIWNR